MELSSVSYEFVLHFISVSIQGSTQVKSPCSVEDAAVFSLFFNLLNAHKLLIVSTAIPVRIKQQESPAQARVRATAPPSSEPEIAPFAPPTPKTLA